MERKRIIIWLLTTFFVVCLTKLISWQYLDVVYSQNIQKQAYLSVVIPQRTQHHEATLTDISQLNRICSSRPQQILPTQVSRSGRTQTSFFNTHRLHLSKSLHSYYDSRCRLESAPFCLSASCDYYVIALRHIIR